MFPFWISDATLDSLSRFGKVDDLGDFENFKMNLGRALYKPAGWNCHINGFDGGKVCSGTQTSHACVHTMVEGQYCGKEPNWVLQAGLNCNGGTW